MDPLSMASLGLNLGGSLYGMLASMGAEREARAQRARALAAMGQQYAQNAYGAQLAGARDLLMQSGLLSDALQTQGRGLGSAMSGAGIFNSSATAGAMANQATANSMALADAAARLAAQRAQDQQQAQNALAGLQMDIANGDIGYARQGVAGAAQGIGGALNYLTYLQEANRQQQAGQNSGVNYGYQYGPTAPAQGPVAPQQTYSLPLPNLQMGAVPQYGASGPQQQVQNFQVRGRAQYGLANGNTVGPAANGMQNGAQTNNGWGNNMLQLGGVFGRSAFRLPARRASSLGAVTNMALNPMGG